MFQGIQSVALPMVQEFGYTREIEDRVLAPLPVALVAIEKIVAGALQGLFAALLVFPIAADRPGRRRCTSHINWPVLLTLAPLACCMCGALGLTFGTRVRPAHGADAVRHHRDPAHVPRLHLLPVAGARADPRGCRSPCSSTRSST